MIPFQSSLQRGNQFLPKLAKGNNNQILIVHTGWADSINHNQHLLNRIFEKLSKDTKISNKKITIPLSNVKTGVYFIRIGNLQEKLIARK
ncbi:MAG: hypothetical protein NZ608_07595 [candidate division WOR-3 bacterium]|nr:hypothetical protein [candidate division WOR-3 bacterium]